MVSSNDSTPLVVTGKCVNSFKAVLKSSESLLKHTHFRDFQSKTLGILLLWRTLKLMCFNSDSDDFEAYKKLSNTLSHTSQGRGMIA